MGLLPENMKSIMINTGNILSLNDITKKPGQNPTEELSEAIQITLQERDIDDLSETNDVVASIMINRRNDDLQEKISSHERQDLKIGIKIFVNTDDESNLCEAINKVFYILKVDTIDNMIIAFHSTEKPEDKLKQLKNVWSTLQNYAKNLKIFQLGLSDIDESKFKSIYEWASIKPQILQINLATCCVVPPTLQAFCKENEVQLLTHSDPSEILPRTSLDVLFKENGLLVNWTTRFQVHIKCRGVLTTKGYLVHLSRP